ncbi:hypothetical protein Tco_0802852 [Tanacetum coccineum]|uniref:RING-type E3 ubiquitin transferase n=1 Tax=Tanacetum coccineum TaxID=301880 RepID=A0ABQ4ZZZ3_9ASTR
MLASPGNIPTGTTPLLYEDDRNRRSLRRQSLRDAARFLRRASSRRMMREPSMLVRETAAEQLEERQSDWAYSKPVVVLDLVWNFAFVVVAFVVLVLSRDEVPVTWLRVWVVGYGVQCVVHMVCVWSEFRKAVRTYGHIGVAKYLESANTMFSFVWWILGFYWVSSGGQALAQDAPKLYWLCVIFLAFDVFFVVFCVALACVIGIAVCCCLPCIIAVLYAVADQEGATKEDIELLPKFTFRRDGGAGKTDDEIQGICGGVMTEYGTDSPIEHVLSAEDASDRSVAFASRPMMMEPSFESFHVLTIFIAAA